MFWVLLILLLLLCIPLFLPVEVKVDTVQNIFSASWKGVGGIRCVPETERWRWFFKIFFVEKEWQPSPSKPQPARKKSPPKRKPPFSPGQMWALVKNMLRAVDLKYLRVNWDTDDFSLNARLYPFFQRLSKGKRQFHINFFGKQEFAILLQTRPCRLVWACLQVFIHPKISKS